MNDHGRVIAEHQPIIEQRPPDTPIAVRKRMDVFKETPIKSRFVIPAIS
jgi:hypothetical protein